MKIGILTSSRADFGIYSPLLQKMRDDRFFEFEIIAFGTHLSDTYGNTADEIIQQGFKISHRLNTLPRGDTPEDISKAIGHTAQIFSHFWNEHQFDLVFALGDRYEMFAAVAAASPFNTKIAHIHAGETTLGAIDNAYRHGISLMSEYLFVTADAYLDRAIEISQKPEHVFKVGALSIDVLKQLQFIDKKDLKAQYGFDLSLPSILTTFHPETVSYKKNEEYITELIKSLLILADLYQIIITMPNSDTTGLMIRRELKNLAQNKSNIFLVESFGIRGYLSCMKHCSFLLGNTSSGFVEAGFFPKYVINLGNRQKGRIITANIKSVEIKESEILAAVDKIEDLPPPEKVDIYGSGQAAEAIIKILKAHYE